MSAYCTESDLYAYGLPRGALSNAGRLVSSVDATANTLTLNVHGFATGDAVTVRAEANGTLATPLVAGTTYYAINVSESTFSVSLTSDGDAIDLTDTGSRIVVIIAVDFATAIKWASSIVEDMLPAHIVPMSTPYHELVIATTAELAAGKLLASRGNTSTSLGEMIDAAQKRLTRWSKGIPLRGDNVPTAATVAVPATAPYLDVRGWKEFGGL